MGLENKDKKSVEDDEDRENDEDHELPCERLFPFLYQPPRVQQRDRAYDHHADPFKKRTGVREYY